MKQGLLLKEAPEAHFELYCNHSYGKGTCNILFDNLEDYNKHFREFHNWDWCLLKELPLRPKRRFNTNQTELDNRKKRLCWCGKPKEKWDKNKYGNPERRGYCSDEHYVDWWLRNDNNAFHRSKFLRSVPRICHECGIKTNYREMDHIIAIVLGGHPWDYRNLQALCEDCHKIKTAKDMKKLVIQRKQEKNQTLNG